MIEDDPIAVAATNVVQRSAGILRNARFDVDDEDMTLDMIDLTVAGTTRRERHQGGSSAGGVRAPEIEDMAVGVSSLKDGAS